MFTVLKRLCSTCKLRGVKLCKMCPELLDWLHKQRISIHVHDSIKLGRSLQTESKDRHRKAVNKGHRQMTDSFMERHNSGALPSLLHENMTWRGRAFFFNLVLATPTIISRSFQCYRRGRRVGSLQGFVRSWQGLLEAQSCRAREQH